MSICTPEPHSLYSSYDCFLGSFNFPKNFGINYNFLQENQPGFKSEINKTRSIVQWHSACLAVQGYELNSQYPKKKKKEKESESDRT